MPLRRSIAALAAALVVSALVMVGVVRQAWCEDGPDRAQAFELRGHGLPSTRAKCSVGVRERMTTAFGPDADVPPTKPVLVRPPIGVSAPTVHADARPSVATGIVVRSRAPPRG